MKKILLASLFLIMPFFAHAEPFDMHAKNLGVLDYETIDDALELTMSSFQCGEAKNYILTGLISAMGNKVFSGEDLVTICMEMLNSEELGEHTRACSSRCGRFGLEYVKMLAQAAQDEYEAPVTPSEACLLANREQEIKMTDGHGNIKYYSTFKECFRFISYVGHKDIYAKNSLADQCVTWIQNATKCQDYLIEIYTEKAKNSKKKKYQCALDKLKTGQIDFPLNMTELESCK